MRTIRGYILTAVFISGVFLCCASDRLSDNAIDVANTLSEKELENGWTLLWDGESFKGWRAIYEKEFPSTGWIIENSSLFIHRSYSIYCIRCRKNINVVDCNVKISNDQYFFIKGVIFY